MRATFAILTGWLISFAVLAMIATEGGHLEQFHAMLARLKVASVAVARGE